MKMEKVIYFTFLQGGYGLIESADDIIYLRKEKRIISEPFNTNPLSPKQNKILSAPFVINEFSCILGLKQGFLKLKKNEQSNETDDDITLREKGILSPKLGNTDFMVFENLYQQGYIVTSAKKYGGEFLIYKGDPLLNHAKAIIFTDSAMGVTEMNRLSTIIKKEGYYAKINNHQDKTVFYTKIERVKD